MHSSIFSVGVIQSNIQTSMKTMIFIITAFVFLKCPVHLGIPDRPEYVPAKEETDFLKNKKIGLIGFHTLSIETGKSSLDLSVKTPKYFRLLEYAEVSGISPYGQYIWIEKGSRGYVRKTVAYPDYRRSTAPLLSFGEELRVLQTRDSFEELPVSLKDFIKKAYNLYNYNMYYEISDLFIFLPEKDIRSGDPGFSLKKFDIDYWIVGCFDPPACCKPSFLEEISSVLCFFSLGFFPAVRTEREKASSFAVFDRDFRLLRQFEYRERIWTLAAIWILWADSLISDPYPPRAYQNEMNRLTRDLYKLLKTPD